MSAARIITIIGMAIIFFYALIQLLNFYGVDYNAYWNYLVFYASIVLSILVLPNSEPTL